MTSEVQVASTVGERRKLPDLRSTYVQLAIDALGINHRSTWHLAILGLSAELLAKDLSGRNWPSFKDPVQAMLGQHGRLHDSHQQILAPCHCSYFHSVH